MVYNAMKLFMEINPQLFDDCSHDYTEHQATAEQRQQSRQSKWDRLAEQAKQMQNGRTSLPPPATNHRGVKVMMPSRIDEDPITVDSQKRLDALKLQDETVAEREQRRLRDHEDQNTVCAHSTFHCVCHLSQGAYLQTLLSCCKF